MSQLGIADSSPRLFDGTDDRFPGNECDVDALAEKFGVLPENVFVNAPQSSIGRLHKGLCVTHACTCVQLNI